NDATKYFSATAQVSLTVIPANTAPTLANVSVVGTEDQVLTFTQANFAESYADPENNPLSSITVKTLPATGVLKLGSATVTVDQVIPSAQLSTLNYVPVPNANGLVTFTIAASDGSLSSSVALVSMNLVPANDAPTLGGIGYGPTYIQESFASATLLTGSISGNASISGGECILTPASSYQYGELALNKLGAASPTAFSAQFDYRANDGTGADGTSFSYGNRANGFSGNIENGLGNGLAVRFIEWEGSLSRVEVAYDGISLTSVRFALMNPAYRTVVIQVDELRRVSVSIGGTSVVSNISLPAAYATADKSAWQFVFAARCGGANNKHSLKNLLIRGIRVGIPSEFTFTEDQPGNLVFSGNPFADVDSTNLTVTLSVEDGTILGNPGTGVTVGGTATARTFAGTVDALNAYFGAAGSITYQGASNNSASRTLTITVSDGGSVATQLATISFTPVNDAPTLATPTSISYQDTSAADIFTNQSGNLTGTDVD
ncbi:hypothetical protein EBU02_14035, partial [bacterium]|nr:hypothetical protein [bacterium]